MSKVVWMVAGIAGLLWLVTQGGATQETTSYPISAPTTNSLRSAPIGDMHGDDDTDGPMAGGDERRHDTDEVREARDAFEDAADELRRSVDALRFNRWDGQMSVIRSRLEDADDALSDLETLRPGDPSVQSARDEIDTMRKHMTRLYHENWRTVRPDLGSSAMAIEDEAEAMLDED